MVPPSAANVGASGLKHCITKMNHKPFEEIPRAGGFIRRLLPIPLDFMRRGGPPYLHEHIDHRHEQLGPIFAEKMGPYELVSISDTNMIRTVMKDDPNAFPETKLPPAWTLYMDDRKLERGLFFQKGDKWLDTRRALDRILLDSDRINTFSDASAGIANDLLDYWQQLTRENESKNRNLIIDKNQVESRDQFILPNSFGTDLSRWSIENIAFMLFGYRLNCLPSLGHEHNLDAIRLANRANDMLDLSNKLQVLPVHLLQRFKFRIWTQFEDSMDELMIVTRNICEKAILAPNQKSLIHDILSTSGLEKEEVIKNMIDFLIAAADTTAASMTWAMYLLAKEPKLQEKARTEVRMNFEEPKNGQKSHSKFKQNHRLNYLDGFLSEVMRLYPPAPFVSRLVRNDCIIGDYRIPAGVHVVIPLITTGRLERYFEDPLRIKPERWMFGTTTKSCPIKSVKIASLPFGLGSRMCIGKKMARLEMNMLLATMLDRYNLELVDDGPIKIKLRMTTWPNKPVKIIMKPLI